MKRILLSLLLLAASALAFALPSVEAVQAEVKAGRYAQAESMMQEVVAAKPKSAKAHYVYAEILAHNGRFDEAARQARQAREIDPAIRFTDPAKFRSFEQLLQREQAAQASPAPSNSALTSPAATPAPTPAAPVRARDSGLPGWAWGLGFAAVAVLVWRLVSRRSAAAAAPAYAGGGYGGYGTPMPTGGAGSGMLGTGLAAAGGFAAGMLAEKMLEGGHHDDGSHAGSAAPGGLQPGMFDDAARSAAGELEDRSIDFGSGGDWGSDAGGGDFGGGDAGGGDW